MKLLPHEAVHAVRWPLFCLLVLSLFILIAPRPAAAQKPKTVSKPAPVEWTVVVEEGKTTISNLGIRNRCNEPHNFQITGNVKF